MAHETVSGAGAGWGILVPLRKAGRLYIFDDYRYQLPQRLSTERKMLP